MLLGTARVALVEGGGVRVVGGFNGADNPDIAASRTLGLATFPSLR